MSNYKKALADVKPGGMVRLVTVPYDRARDLIGDAYNAGTHGIGYSQQAMELQDAIIPAQHSPGGQDALAALQQDYDKLLDSFNRQVEVAEKIAGRALQQDDRIEELEEALAARQPVGEPVAEAIEQLADDVESCVSDACGYLASDSGWDDYGIYRDDAAARYRALPDRIRALAAPPAQGVDLGGNEGYGTRYVPPVQAFDPGQFRESVERLKDEALHERDPGPAVNAYNRVLALIDSQAVGNG